MGLSHCCFVIDLRTGSLILGYLNLVGYSLLGLMSIIGLTASSALAKGTSEEAQVIGGIISVILIVLLIIVFVNLIFIILLLVGLHQNKRGHITAYLIFSVIMIVFSFISFITALAKGTPFKSVVQLMIQIGISIYTVLVIKSYLQKLKDNDQKPAIYNKA